VERSTKTDTKMVALSSTPFMNLLFLASLCTLIGCPFGTWQLIVWLHKLKQHSVLSEFGQYILTLARMYLSFTSYSQWTASICFSNLQLWLKGDPPHEFLRVAEMCECRERGGQSRADLEAGHSCWWDCWGTLDSSPVTDRMWRCKSRRDQSATFCYRPLDSCPQLFTVCVWSTAF
jgi:hypothetical protein